MMRKNLVLGLIWLAFTSPMPILSQGRSPAGPADVAGLMEKAASRQLVRVIIEIEPGLEAALALAPEVRAERSFATGARLQARLLQLRVAYVRRLDRLPLIVAEVDRSQLERLLREPGIRSIQEDGILEPHLADSGPLVHAPQVWANGYRGAGFAVAILDTGVQASHPFLSPRIVSEACYSSVSAAENATSACPGGATNGPTNSGSGQPCTFSQGCSHGTHVAGIAAGRATAQMSYSGMAPDASIIAIQIFSRFNSSGQCKGNSVPCARAFTSDMIRGLERVLTLSSQVPIASVNISVGGGRYNSPCDTDLRKPLIDALLAARVATIASSGNEYMPAQVGAPACISSAITVGSTTKAGPLSGFSNHGPMVDLLAPGSNISSSVPVNSQATFSGTSMAAPHVAGAFAVLRSRLPGATAQAIEQALEVSGVPVAHPTTGLTKPRILLDAAAESLDPHWIPKAHALGDGSGIHTYPALVGDVNGDGRTDLIFVGQDWNGAGLNVRVKLSNGDGTWTPKEQALGDGSGIHAYPTLVGDVNGDKRADLIFVGQDWNGAGLNVRVKLSNGDGTWTPKAQALGDGSGIHAYPTLVGDVNGDGRSDLIFVGQNWNGAGLNVRVKLSNGDGTWTPKEQALGDGSGVHAYPTLVGDVNGDGRVDLVLIGQGTSPSGFYIRTKISNGNGTWTARDAYLGDGSAVHQYPALLADVSGDGRGDLILFGQNWDGPGLNIRTKLADF